MTFNEPSFKTAISAFNQKLDPTGQAQYDVSTVRGQVTFQTDSVSQATIFTIHFNLTLMLQTRLLPKRDCRFFIW